MLLLLLNISAVVGVVSLVFMLCLLSMFLIDVVVVDVLFLFLMLKCVLLFLLL